MTASPRHRSYWLQQALGDATDAPPLHGDVRADVVIAGGGFVGLWTALAIKQWSPGTDVVVLEQDVCGGGASGRNGGFVLSWWAKFPSLAALLGPETAAEVCRVSERAIGEIGAFCTEHGIEADFVQAGWLWTARTQAHIGSWEGTVAAVEEYAPDVYERLTPEEVARRAGSTRHLAGVLERSGATVQPARLVRGMRRVALEQGVRIHEHTRMRSFSRTAPVTVRTENGSVTARTLVLATNAWAASTRELHRKLAVISSDVIATEPIPGRLEEIGWTGGECITDSQLMVDYYRTTADGRIAFGKGGWGVALAGRVPASFDRNRGRARVVAEDMHDAYPSLRDVRVEHDWSGPIDRSADGLPLLGRLGGRDHIVYGVGWSGNGVGPSLVGGRVLAAHALGLDNEYGRLPLWERSAGGFPPDPVRFVGAHLVREGVRRKERAERRGVRPSRAAVALAGLAPAGLEDH